MPKITDQPRTESMVFKATEKLNDKLRKMSFEEDRSLSYIINRELNKHFKL